jgi:regulator of replication initiation timing
MENRNFIKVEKVSNPQKKYYQLFYTKNLNCGGQDNVLLSYDISEKIQMYLKVMILENELGVKAIYKGFDINDFQGVIKVLDTKENRECIDKLNINFEREYKCEFIKNREHPMCKITCTEIYKEVENMENKNFIKVQKVSNPQKTYYQLIYQICGPYDEIGSFSYNLNEIWKLHIKIMKLEEKLRVKATYEGCTHKDFYGLINISNTKEKSLSDGLIRKNSFINMDEYIKDIEELKDQLAVSEKLNKELHMENEKLYDQVNNNYTAYTNIYNAYKRLETRTQQNENLMDIAYNNKITLTKTRRFEIDNGNKYNNIGRLMGNHYNYSRICPKEDYYKKQEQDAQDKIKQDLVESIRSQRFGNFSMEKLQKILKIINEE